ncbi:plastocyanin/azurin family copper-binding protein [Rhizobium giardinii]|jgi:uncharacterized cupredoxin-like copper-binding protein|uniref:plastocyanin/azurin family copper-binding protein n=1 Tax=Rhizobium giardinii TaxID=56731 RepID=UPI000DD62B7E
MFIRNASLALAALFIATPVFAATTINVVEDGEGGGKMSLVLDQQTVSAGPAIFKVHNDAAGEEHEMVLVRLKSADAKIPLLTEKHRVDEKQLQSLGEVEDLAPGADGQLKADLEAGTYLLLCNLKGHYEAGMQAVLTVTD